MIIAKHIYMPDRNEWLAVIAEGTDPDAPYSTIEVLDVETRKSEAEILEWIKQALVDRPWEHIS